MAPSFTTLAKAQVNARTLVAITLYDYRQHCAQRKTPVFKLSYSEADYNVFAPQGRHVAPMGVIFGVEAGTFVPLLYTPNFIPHRCNDKGIGPPKLKFLLKFDQNLEYQRPAGMYPLHDFQKICGLCTPFQDALAVKISLDFLKGFGVMGLLS